MGAKSKIEWTNATWNPLRGCSRISEGCRFCYAEGIAARFSGHGMAYEGLAHRVGGEARWTGNVVLVEDKLTMPLRWKKPRMIFVNSTSDLFHESVPDEWIDRVFAVMALCPQHTFQVLTKRADRMRFYMGRPSRHDTIAARWNFRADRPSAGNNARAGLWPFENVWLGVSIEDQATADARIPHLLATPAAKRFVSYEPALATVYFTPWLYMRETERDGDIVDPLDWIIVGGESGRGARHFEIEWARDVIAQCRAARVACFVKQLGANPQEVAYPADVTHAEMATWVREGWTHIVKTDDSSHWRRYWHLNDRKGGDIAEWPEDLRVREFPQ